MLKKPDTVIGVISDTHLPYRMTNLPTAIYHIFQGVDYILQDELLIRMGDKQCEVIHISTHSHDSVCIYCKDSGILFAGDTNFPIEFENDLLKAQNAHAISRLERKNIQTLYNGHGPAQDYSNKKFIAIKKKEDN